MGAQEAGAAAQRGTSRSLVPAAGPGRGAGSGCACSLGLQSRRGGEGHSWRKALEPGSPEGGAGFHALCDRVMLGPGRKDTRGSPGVRSGPGKGGGCFTKMGLCRKRPGCRFACCLRKYLYVAWHSITRTMPPHAGRCPIVPDLGEDRGARAGVSLRLGRPLPLRVTLLLRFLVCEPGAGPWARRSRRMRAARPCSFIVMKATLLGVTSGCGALSSGVPFCSLRPSVAQAGGLVLKHLGLGRAASL